jgi:hypothetical protein
MPRCKLVLLALFLCLSSCLGLENLDFGPFFGQDPAGPRGEAATFEPALLGDWTLDEDVYRDGSREYYWRIERESADSKACIATGWSVRKSKDGTLKKPVKDETDVTRMHYLKLGEHSFLSFSLPSAESRPEWVGFWVQRIDRLDDEIHVADFDTDYFRSKEHQSEIAIRISKNRVVLTATPAELRAFLESHAETPGLWTDPYVLARRRPAEATK